MNKKAQIDILTTGLVLFVIALVCLLGYKMVSAINTNVQLNNQSLSAEARAGSANYTSSLASGFDQGIVVALGFVFVLTLVFASQINTNPGYFWIFLFILIFTLATTAILSQVFEQGTNAGDFVAERAAMPMVAWIGTNVFSIAAAMAVLLFVVIFAKVNKGSV